MPALCGGWKGGTMYCVYRISGDKKLLIARTKTMERAALLAQRVMTALRLWRNDTDSVVIEMEDVADD